MSASINMLCAGGFRAAMDLIGPQFQNNTGIALNMTYATPGKTREIFEQGFTFDLGVVVASVVTKAQQDGLVQDLKTLKLAISPVGFGVAKSQTIPDISTLDAFRKTLASLNRLGLSDPAAGTNLALELMAAAEKIGIAEDLRAKALFINGPGSAVSAAVARGEADAVITLASEIKPIPGISFAGAIPSELQTEYAMQAIMPASLTSAAQKLMDYICSQDAKEMMRQIGLKPIV